MQIELTQQQRDMLGTCGSERIRVFNPSTKQVFILVPAEEFERLQYALGPDLDPREAYPLVDRIMAEDDANDPYLHTYQNIQREAQA